MNVTTASLRQFLQRTLPSDNSVFTTKDERIVSLLSSSVVVHVMRTLPPTDARFVQVDSHRNAVHDILLQLVMRRHQEEGKEKNVLAAGLWLHEGTRSIQCAWPNLAVNTIRSQLWESLHGYIGTDVLRFLLLHTTVLVPLEDGKGFLQLCGPPPPRSKTNAKGHLAVERWRVFYHAHFIKKAGFEPGHVLFCIVPTERFANHLCRLIFDCPDGKRLHRRYLGVRPLLLQMAQNQAFGKVPYGLLLEVLCPLSPKGSSCAPTEHDQVIKFVWACLLKLVPRAMWGNVNNMRVARAMIAHFVRLRRYEAFHLDPFVDQWQMSSCREWIPKTKTPTQFRVHKTMVRQWLAWFVNVLVMPLIRNHFYVTESSVAGHGARVFYFRKPLWKQLISQAHVEERLHLGPAPSARQTVSARLRLVPKSINGAMRIVARVMHNKQLRVVLDVMQWELFGGETTHADLLGASVFGFHDVFKRLSVFKSQQGGNGPWFFVKVDAKAAFDSIRQDVLCRILSQGNIFSHERYCLQRYRVNGKLKTRVIPASDFSPLKPDTRRSGGGAIVTDCAWGEFVSRKELYDLLFEHIRLNVVQWRGQRFRQKVGIAQGSVLSSLLCSIYYGHMEHALGLITTRLPGLLMRWTDDTIFITRDLDAARTFLHQIQNDSVEYGLVLGSDKGCSNVPLAGLKCRDDGHFAWCGLLFDTRTLEVSWDYARYEGTRISDTLTAPASGPGPLLEKLKQYVSVKCVAVLMSLEINSYDKVLFNVYQMFLYVAMKFSCLGGAGALHVICDLIRFVSSLLRSIHPHPVHYLGMHAFHVILSRKGSDHSMVLVLSAIRETIDAIPVYLKESLSLIVDSNRSEVFERILF